MTLNFSHLSNFNFQSNPSGSYQGLVLTDLVVEIGAEHQVLRHEDEELRMLGKGIRAAIDDAFESYLLEHS